MKLKCGFLENKDGLSAFTWRTNSSLNEAMMDIQEEDVPGFGNDEAKLADGTQRMNDG